MNHSNVLQLFEDNKRIIQLLTDIRTLLAPLSIGAYATWAGTGIGLAVVLCLCVGGGIALAMNASSSKSLFSRKSYGSV